MPIGRVLRMRPSSISVSFSLRPSFKTSAYRSKDEESMVNLLFKLGVSLLLILEPTMSDALPQKLNTLNELMKADQINSYITECSSQSNLTPLSSLQSSIIEPNPNLSKIKCIIVLSIREIMLKLYVISRHVTVRLCDVITIHDLWTSQQFPIAMFVGQTVCESWFYSISLQPGFCDIHKNSRDRVLIPAKTLVLSVKFRHLEFSIALVPSTIEARESFIVNILFSTQWIDVQLASVPINDTSIGFVSKDRFTQLFIKCLLFCLSVSYEHSHHAPLFPVYLNALNCKRFSNQLSSFINDNASMQNTHPSEWNFYGCSKQILTSISREVDISSDKSIWSSICIPFYDELVHAYYGSNTDSLLISSTSLSEFLHEYINYWILSTSKKNHSHICNLFEADLPVSGGNNCDAYNDVNCLFFHDRYSQISISDIISPVLTKPIKGMKLS
jgi:hypothetical protein